MSEETGGPEGSARAAEPVRRTRAAAASGAARRGALVRRPHATVGGVIGGSLRVWTRNFLSFVAVSALVFSPYIALQLWRETQTPGEEEVEAAWMMASAGLQWFLGLVLTGALIYGVFQELRGRRASLGEILAHGAARIGHVFAVGILVAICVSLPMMPGLIAALGGVPIIAGLLIFAGFVGVAVVACGLFVAIPACVVERPGIWGAVARSWDLTRGYKWTVLGIVAVYSLFSVLVAAIVGGVVGLMLDAGLRMLEVAIVVFTSSISAVFAAVAYHDIRASKEGVGTEELAAIFD